MWVRDSREEMTIFILASVLGAEEGGASADSMRNPANWPPPRPADIVDIAVTALHHLGFEIGPARALDGRPPSNPR